MITQFPIKLILILAVLLFLFSLAGIADARGFSRGGGGFSRGGAASGGSFSRGGDGGGFSRSAASSGSVQKQAQFSGQQGSMQRSTQPATEQGGAADRQSQRQEAAGGMQQDRQDYHTEKQDCRTSRTRTAKTGKITVRMPIGITTGMAMSTKDKPSSPGPWLELQQSLQRDRSLQPT